MRERVECYTGEHLKVYTNILEHELTKSDWH